MGRELEGVTRESVEPATEVPPLPASGVGLAAGAEFAAEAGFTVELDSGSRYGLRFVMYLMVFLFVPAGFGLLFSLRILRLVAIEPLWVYGALFVVSECMVYFGRLWEVEKPSSTRFYVQMSCSYFMCTLTVYLTGWGPELMIAFVTVGAITVVRNGSKNWKLCLAINCFCICLGQIAVAVHFAPSKLPVAWAEALALMGFILLLITLRLVAFSVEKSEHIALLLQKSEARFRYEAQHDALTGLPNRRYFLEHLREAMEGGRRRIDENLPAVFYVDLDKFKEINDRFGHAAGDTLLVDFAGRLAEVTRDSDLLARLGGDEFVVLRDSVPDSAAAMEMANRLLRCVEEPFVVGGRESRVEMSVGIAVAEPGTGAEELLDQADRAMYLAKAEQHSHVFVSPPQVVARGQHR